MSVARGRALGLLAGLGADAVLGDPPNRWHPTAWFGTWAGWLERRCYADSVPAGVGHVVAAVAPVTLVGVGVEALGRRWPWLRPGCTALATWAVVGAHSLAHEGRTMAGRLEAGDLPGAREQLSHLCGRQAAGLDEPELARATIESLAENTADSVVASVFWGALLGAPGLLTHRAVNTLDAMVGHRSERYERFGKCAARLDDALDLLPARATGLLAGLVSPRPIQTWRVTIRDARNHPSPNGGWCEAAWAAALGVALGGTNVYPGGRVEDRGVLNPGGRPPDGVAVRRASRMVTAVTTLAGAGAGAGAAAALLVFGARRRR